MKVLSFVKCFYYIHGDNPKAFIFYFVNSLCPSRFPFCISDKSPWILMKICPFLTCCLFYWASWDLYITMSDFSKLLLLVLAHQLMLLLLNVFRNVLLSRHKGFPAGWSVACCVRLKFGARGPIHTTVSADRKKCAAVLKPFPCPASWALNFWRRTWGRLLGRLDQWNHWVWTSLCSIRRCQHLL